jgi:hypothetical protein
MSVIIRNRQLEDSRKFEGSPSQSKRPSHKVVRREIKIEQPKISQRKIQRLEIERGRHLEPGSRDARLQEVEDRLLAKMIATHENREHALDRLLHDVLDESNAETASRTLPLKGAACISKRLHRTEDLLVAAVIENHPNAARGLDRLMEDLYPADIATPACEWDNDWDGMA